MNRAAASTQTLGGLKIGGDYETYMSINDPQSKADIISALEHLRRDGLQYWSEFSAEQFAAPIGEAWSPADNVRHLIKSTRPVSRALRLPHFVLGALFGSSDGRSRTYSELRAQYHEVLRQGGQAGRFAPSKTATPEDLSAWQSELVRSCRDGVGELAR